MWRPSIQFRTLRSFSRENSTVSPVGKEIAKHSDFTCKTHVYSLYGLLGCCRRVDELRRPTGCGGDDAIHDLSRSLPLRAARVPCSASGRNPSSSQAKNHDVRFDTWLRR